MVGRVALVDAIRNMFIPTTSLGERLWRLRWSSPNSTRPNSTSSDPPNMTRCFEAALSVFSFRSVLLNASDNDRTTSNNPKRYTDDMILVLISYIPSPSPDGSADILTVSLR